MSLFSGKTGLRIGYKELTAAQLAGATTLATAKLLETLRSAGRLSYIDNSTDKDLWIAFVHPEADPLNTAFRLPAFEIPSDRVLNFSELFPGLYFDPGTYVYVYSPSGAVTSGKVRLINWG